jgi:hypothetical protein
VERTVPLTERTKVHVVQLAGGGLAPVLRAALGGNASVTVWSDAPRPAALCPTDLVVVDLDRAPPTLTASVGAAILRRSNLLLAVGGTPVAPHWLELVGRRGVRTVLACRSKGTYDFRCVVAEVLAWIRGPTGRQVTDLVLTAAPGFRALPHLVDAVCTDPWRVRRPRDLAATAGISLDRIRRDCYAAGFERVDHFMMCVRAVAYEQLVVVARMPHAAARTRVGFTDASNMHRHVVRALAHSPQAAAMLRERDGAWRRLHALRA